MRFFNWKYSILAVFSVLLLFITGNGNMAHAQGTTAKKPLRVTTSEELKSHDIYDFIAAANEGKSVGEMVLDIEDAPRRAYDNLESSILIAARMVRPQDDELTAIRKVDRILFKNIGFQRGLPGTTFSDAMLEGKLDCSDASTLFLSISERMGRKWVTALAPFHMFIAAYDSSGYIFWETQEGSIFNLEDMIEFHGLKQELIDNGVYLGPMPISHHVAEAYRNIGGLKVRDGDLDEAIWHLEKSLWLRPTYPPTLIWLGYAYGLKGDYTTAEENYLKALSIDPNDWVANLHIGALYAKKGMWTKAEEYTRLAEELRPPNSDWVLQEALPYITGAN